MTSFNFTNIQQMDEEIIIHETNKIEKKRKWQNGHQLNMMNIENDHDEERDHFIPNKLCKVNKDVDNKKKYKHSSEKPYFNHIKFKKSNNHFTEEMKKIYRERAKARKRSKKHLFIHRSYSYELPFVFSRPFDPVMNELTQQANINIHLYIITLDDPAKSQLSFLCPNQIGNISSFKIYLPKSKTASTKTNLVLGSQMNESTLKALFNEVHVYTKYQGLLVFPQKDFDDVYQFYLHFFGDIYGIIPQKLLASICASYMERGSDNCERTYLILPAKNNKIDFEFIKKFMCHREFARGNGSTSVINHVNNGYKPKLVSDMLTELKQKPDQLRIYLSQQIFESVYGTHSRYYHVDHILEPTIQPAKDFIQLVSKYYVDKTYEDLLNIFNLTDELAENMTVDKLLYEHQIEKVEFLSAFRKLDQKYKVTIDHTHPLVFVQPPLNPIAFDYINPSKTINSYSSCRKDIVLVTSLSNFPLIPSQFLQEYCMKIQEYDLFVKVPSIMTTLERIALASELKHLIQIPSLTDHLVTATNTSSYDIFDHNEILEMVGDSALKFLVSLYLLLKHPEYDESIMTSKRTNYITNNILMNVGIKNSIGFYLKTMKRNVSEWKPSYFKYDQKKIVHRITGKQLADCIEALIGACFVSGYNLYYPLKFIENIGLPVSDFIICTKIIQESNIIIPSKYLPKASILFNENMTYVELRESVLFQKLNYRLKDQNEFMFDELQKPFHLNRKNLCSSAYKTLDKLAEKNKMTNIQYSTKLIYTILNNFERKYLGYKFKNKAYLVQALNCDSIPGHSLFEKNYETLEFFGDSIVEIYMTGNAFKILKEKGINFSPNLLQNMKISLLTNAFMARISVMSNFHPYIITKNQDIINEVNAFVKKVKVKSQYKTFVKHKLATPKIISDIFEALAGAVLIDGGWDAFHLVFGRMMGPYLQFFCHFYDKMQTNIVETFQKKALEENQITEYRKSYNSEKDLHVYEVYKGGVFICSASSKTAKIAKERAGYKACKICKYI